MLKHRMSVSYGEGAGAWLREKCEETGATKGGVVRMLILKEMLREETRNGRKVNPKRKG